MSQFFPPASSITSVTQATPGLSLISGVLSFNGASYLLSNGSGASLTGITASQVSGVFAITSANLINQSAGVTSIVTVTPSVLGTYRIGAYLNVISRTLDVVQISVSYKDETGTSQTVFLSGFVAATGITNISPVDIRAASGTAIIVAATLTTGGGSISFDVGATIQQLN
jgi:hypothetical protein